MVVHAGAQAGLAVLRHRIGGQCDDGQALARRLLARADLPGRLESVHLGHVAIHQDEVEVALRVGIQRFAAVVDHRHAVALDLQDAERNLLVDEVVFHQQDLAAGPGQRLGSRARARAGAATGSCGWPAMTFTRHSYSTVWRTGLARQASKPAVARVPHVRLAAGQHDQPHPGDLGAGPDRARELRRVHARQPEVDDRNVVGSASRRRLRQQLDRLLRRRRDPVGHSPVAHLRVQDAAVDGVRLDDERAHAREHAHRGRRRVFLRRRFLLLEAAGEREGRAGAGRGFDADAAAHHFHQLLADGEAQARAAVLARGRSVGLRELVEDAGLRFGADADAGVADLEAHGDVLRGLARRWRRGSRPRPAR